MRLLSETEENRIIDSSCDFKDSISTQALLDREPDTVVIKENTSTEIAERNNEDESIRLSVAGSSAPFKNLKLPDGESPWLSRVRDPFHDSETPWLNKIKDPFKETPLNEKVLDTYGETPDSNKKLLDPSLNTPSAAHKIFQKLRETGNQKDLDFDSETVPELFKDTQPELSLGNSQENSNEDELMSFNNDYTNEIEFTKKDTTTEDISTPLINDTILIGEPNQSSGPQDPKSDNTQADIQVPGTAPEPDHDDTLHQVDEEAIEEKELPRKANGESSPINSDDEDNFSLDLGRRLHSEPISGDYLNILAEDSIQKYHRDLSKRGPRLQQKPNPSSENVTRTSQSKRLNSLPLNLDIDPLHARKVNNPVQLNSHHQELSKKPNELQNESNQTLSSKVESSPSTATTEKAENNDLKYEGSITVQDENTTGTGKDLHSQSVEFNALAENVTQDLSDVDDESKVVDNTIEEEADSAKIQTEWNQEVPRSSNPIRRSKRNVKSKSQLHFASSPNKSFDQSNISLALDANTSEIGEDDASDLFANDNQSVLTPVHAEKNLPTEVLREELHKLTEKDIMFKDSVWSLTNTRYFPGLILNLGKKGLVVKFSEGPTEINGGIFPLDIQIGDHVKFERFTYLVTGLECVLQDFNDDVIRCMRGYDTVLVKRIKGKGKNMKIDNTEEKIPLADIHIENEEWHKRPRVLNEIKAKRSTLNQSEQLKRVLPKTYEEELVLSTPKKPKYSTTGIFVGCIFVITGDVDKSSLTKSIVVNGGTVIEDGFSSMIDFENGVPSSDAFKDFSFAALITKKYLRSPKYLETVALGWPLLSQEFVYDCISRNHLIHKISPYLLPSGESSKLKGVVKSCDVFAFLQNWSLGHDLSGQLQNNTILLSRNVFICSKKNIEITQFLFKILGCKTVVIVPITNYSNLINTVTENFNDGEILIYHDKLGDIKSILDTKPIEGKKRKLKRGSILSEVLGNNKKLKMELVDWEWLVQCVISAYPWESQCRWTSK